MLNQIFRNKYSLIALQFTMLFVFVFLIYGAIGITTDDKSFAKVLRNTNFSNLIVWSYWWPMIIATAIIFGRFWCAICPVELITSFFAKIGFRRKPNSLLKSGWIVTFFYAMILIIGIHTLAIHRIPQYMAIYMLILFLIAVIVGVIWEKRTFCTYVCPIGHLLGFYSMLSLKQLRVKNVDICKSCKTKDCISKENHYNQIGRSCTSELYPATLIDNKDCILCGQCHKSCTKDNIAIKTRTLALDLYTNINLSWAEISFFIMLSGFVIYEVLSEWKLTKGILMSVPNWLNSNIGTEGNFIGTIKALSLFVILPMAFFLIFALSKKIIANESWKKSFSQLVLAILPVTASMHLLKALLKTTSRIPYWEYIFTDRKGVETANAIINNPEYLHKEILTIISPFLSLIALLLSLGGIVLSLYIIKKQDLGKLSKIISIIAMIFYASFFLISIIIWKFVQ